MKKIIPFLFFVCFFVVACGEEKSTSDVAPVEQQSDEVVPEKAVEEALGSVPQEDAAQTPGETARTGTSGQTTNPEELSSKTAAEEVSPSPESLETEPGEIPDSPLPMDGFPPPETQEGLAPPADEAPADEAPASEIISDTAPAIAGKPAALKKCEACHTFDKDGATKVGPNLFGIYGKEAGKFTNFQYTKDFLRTFQGKVWDGGSLDAWIADSKKMATKSKMVIKTSNPEDRAAIIYYIKSLK